METSTPNPLSTSGSSYEPIRRSLRQKGLRPDSEGFPYYSPAKPSRSASLHEDHKVEMSEEEDTLNEVKSMPQSDSRISQGDVRVSCNGEQTECTGNGEASLDGAKVHKHSPRGDKLAGLPNGADRDCVDLTPNSRSASVTTVEDLNACSATASEQRAGENEAEKTVRDSRSSCRSLNFSDVQLSASHERHGEAQTQTRSQSQTENSSEGVTPGSPSVEPMDVASVADKDLEVFTSQKNTLPSGTEDTKEAAHPVTIDKARLLAVFERAVRSTESSSVEQMEHLLATLEHIVFRHRMNTDRGPLLQVSSAVLRVNCARLSMCI